MRRVIRTLSEPFANAKQFFFVLLFLSSPSVYAGGGGDAVGNGPGPLTQILAPDSKGIGPSYSNDLAATIEEELTKDCTRWSDRSTNQMITATPPDPSRLSNEMGQVYIQLLNPQGRPLAFADICTIGPTSLRETYLELVSSLYIASAHPFVRHLIESTVFAQSEKPVPITIQLSDSPGTFTYSEKKVVEFTWYQFKNDILVWSKRPANPNRLDAMVNRPSAAYLVHNLGHIFSNRLLQSLGFDDIGTNWHALTHDNSEFATSKNLYQYETTPLASIVESFSNVLETPFLTMLSRHPYMVSALDRAICTFDENGESCLDDRYYFDIPESEMGRQLTQILEALNISLQRHGKTLRMNPKEWPKLLVAAKTASPQVEEEPKAVIRLIMLLQITRLLANEAYLSTSLNYIVHKNHVEIFFGNRKQRVNCAEEKTLIHLIDGFADAAIRFAFLLKQRKDWINDPWMTFQGLLVSWLTRFDELESGDAGQDLTQTGLGIAYLKEFFFFDASKFLLELVKTRRLPQDIENYFIWPNVQINESNNSAQLDSEKAKSHFKKILRSEPTSQRLPHLRDQRRLNGQYEMTCE